ncbi:LOW QUALITY PROTEIN: uncharacterized protein At4g02000-like [Arabidopsis lyrata subsp. lyrata]|uniref:LOW QUALITY PROTEIN: uncharacterized protein At4g02000-like n=1 Tax=Arabidopsis lyrata subsp. lyrata TaxID=81972 RepID=UPI000A29AE12|nr:LOW QUALITY PROTEIN: uncharacterized protein At4g02000-like [Arabidopsis lyrata subsp. lyrata]|eukprot:XP_020871811.1 LOW QUALITY PROTEIN: uncharacterized protein At4g02000-like [Arabidopsis lyrata subsp. lyrata]
MADELWNNLQHFDLGRNDPELFIPHEAYAATEARNRLSLIARPLNPRSQNLFTVISSLPRTWGLTTTVQGRVLDGTYVQFLFQSELDLVSVQRREPWLFNNWFIAVQRREPVDFPGLNFLTTIDLWVQIRGIPLHYVSVETVSEIAQDLGEIIQVDFNETTSIQIAYIRVRVRFGISDRLRFFQRIRFDAGETVVIRFQYERLRRICTNCLRFNHQRNQCPYGQLIDGGRSDDLDHTFAGRERRFLQDNLQRSNMNSQSQNSDYSFPAPRSTPPRVATPPLNPEETVDARRYLSSSRIANLQHFAVPTPQIAVRRQQSASSSNSNSATVQEMMPRDPRRFETGESSRRTENGEPSERFDYSKRKKTLSDNQEEENMNQKQKGSELNQGGILKPPKKR